MFKKEMLVVDDGWVGGGGEDGLAGLSPKFLVGNFTHTQALFLFRLSSCQSRKDPRFEAVLGSSSPIQTRHASSDSYHSLPNRRY